MELETEFTRRYNYVLLQNGTLPLSPEGTYNYSLEHRCTSVIIWPEDEQPSFNNTVAVDPCFTSQGFLYAAEQLEQLHLSFLDIGWVFVTHRHGDHLPNLTRFLGYIKYKKFRAGANKAFASISNIRHPGHAPDLRVFAFRPTSRQTVCVTGDAILDERWLKAWRYYWPNGYTIPEIVQTWESVANIISYADLIIPGHGEPIPVTAALVQEVLAMFAHAKHASECQDVEQLLSNRLEQLRAQE